MGTSSTRTVVVDTSDGSVYTRRRTVINGEEVQVTGTYTEHPIRKLAGKSFVTLEPLSFSVADTRFPGVITEGDTVILNGGTELDVHGDTLDLALEDIENAEVPDDSPAQYIPVIPAHVNDPAWPPMLQVLVALPVLMKQCNEIKKGAGPHVRRRLLCSHKKFQAGCKACFRHFWFTILKERGILR